MGQNSFVRLCYVRAILRRRLGRLAAEPRSPRPENGMARAWETLAKYIDHYEEARAEPTKDAD
jgi:hypothetical protein